jgi:membrane protein DedA with SNARE-associated domain
VQRRDWLMVLLIRFAPGLRIAIAAACAWVDMSPRKFSVLNLLSAFVWAFSLLVLVGWFGPSYLAYFGLEGWKGALVIGIVIVALFKAFGAIERRALTGPDSV